MDSEGVVLEPSVGDANEPASGRHRLALLSDQPLYEGDDTDRDGLGFRAYADVLSAAVLDTDGPFTIGVFGEWGTGKTSLMRMIERSLRDVSGVCTVWFNAWRYEKEEHPVIPLVASVSSTLEQRRDFEDRLKDDGRKFLKALRSAAYGLSGSLKLGLGEVKLSGKEAIDRYEKLTKRCIDSRSVYEQAFQTLQSVSLKGKFKTVLFVDDLDRCLPDRALELLESIKLVLSQPGFVFVLGVSKAAIEGYVRHRYATNFGQPQFDGSSYFDKIIQLSFPIPPHNSRMTSFSEAVVANLASLGLASDLQRELAQVVPIITRACKANPRSVIRLVNNLIIDQSISSALSVDQAGARVPLSYFAVARSLQLAWPIVYSALSAAPDLCTELSSKDPKACIDGLKSKHPDVAAAVSSDDDLMELLRSEPAQHWLKEVKQRTAVREFLVQRQGAARSNAAPAGGASVILRFMPGHSEEALAFINMLYEAGVRVANAGDRKELVVDDYLPSADYMIVCIDGPIPKTEPSFAFYVDGLVDLLFERGLVPVFVVLKGGEFPMLPPRLVGVAPAFDFRYGLNLDAVAPLLNMLSLPIADVRSDVKRRAEQQLKRAGADSQK